MKHKPKNYPALTGVRAIAAYLVYLHHVRPEKPAPWLTTFAREGHVGVTLFFVLSGFVIANTYMQSAEGRRSWLVNYYWNRFIRIFPVYWLLLLLNFAWLAPTSGFLFWFLNMSLLKGASSTTWNIGINQTWSLAVELCFYIAAPFVFLFSRKFSLKPLIVVSLLLNIVLFSMWKFSDQFEYPLSIDWMYLLFWTIVGRTFEFLIGIYLAIKMQNRNVPGESLGYSRNTWIGLSAMTISVFFMTCFQEGPTNAGVFAPEAAFLNTVVLGASTALFYYGLTTEASLLGKILSGRVFQLLGKASYVFYMIHIGHFADWLKQLFGISGFGPTFLLVQTASILLFLGFEEPVNRLLRLRASAGNDRPAVLARSG